MTDKIDIVAIDGPSGSGKSTISRLLADRLNYTYLDTGAMYRAVGYKAYHNCCDIRDPDGLQNLLDNLDLKLLPGEMDIKVILDGKDISQAIRTAEMGMLASEISALAPVRKKLTDIQQQQGTNGSVVAEGRDMGTVVFPYAKNKFFLSATSEERAKRRTKQLHEKGIEANYQEILSQINIRDHDDSTRALAPLKPAEDAIVIDSSNMSIEEVVKFMMDKIRSSP